MKGDFTRFGFDRSKHISRVLHQQGRVPLDSDYNLAAEVLLHHLRTLTRDLYGGSGGPADSGFTLALDGATPPLLWIGPGHYYVQGILCENEAWVDYGNQPDHVVAPADANGNGGDAVLAWLRNPTQQQRFWLYLDVWEHHVTWIEDDSIRETALGGPDTTTRAKVVWQLKALPWDADEWGDATGADACPLPLPSLTAPSPARMAARVDPGPGSTDPCVVSPKAQYRGPENHLYRIEIHTGGVGGDATFKWSRDNGTVATRWLGIGHESNSIIVKSSRGFAAGDWVELSHDALDLAGTPGQLLRLSVVEGDQCTFDAASVPAGGVMAWSETLSNPKVRRWDQRRNDVVGLRNGAVPVTESEPGDPQWIDLEDGLQVSFANGGRYRSGDFWVVTARVATEGTDWPMEDGMPAWRGPLGIAHAYAPLGVLSTNTDGRPLVDLCRNCVQLAPVECVLPTPPALAPPRPPATPRSPKPPAAARRKSSKR